MGQEDRNALCDVMGDHCPYRYGEGEAKGEQKDWQLFLQQSVPGRSSPQRLGVSSDYQPLQISSLL